MLTCLIILIIYFVFVYSYVNECSIPLRLIFERLLPIIDLTLFEQLISLVKQCQKYLVTQDYINL